MLDPSKLDSNLENENNVEQKTSSILDDLKNSITEEDKILAGDNKQVDNENQIYNFDGSGNKIIFDINIISIDIILNLLVDNKYDFVTFEPSEDAVKITFRKDSVIKDIKYIKYPTYSNILLKAKILTNLTLDETENEQEGNGNIKIKDNNYKIITKIVPSPIGTKMFLKAIETQEKIEKKAGSKTSFSKIMTYLGIIALITLIVGGAFISFIVVNAKTVEDVSFFASLGINLNDINNFLGQIVTIIFSILVFVETIFLVTVLFKFFLTKKEFKKKKIKFGVLSVIILMLTFATGSTWMIIDKKIRALPNWQEMAYGDVQLYDNSKLTSDSFSKAAALLKDTTNLIGPVEIKFDLSFYAQSEARKGLTISKYMWDFGDGELEETLTPTIIHNFDTQGNHEVILTVEQIDLQGKTEKKQVEGIPNINISYLVKIIEKTLDSGGKLVEFDATSLSELGKIEWYFMDDLDNPKYTGDYFRYGTPIFDETIVGMYIRRSDKTTTTLDKVFIIGGESETSISGKINYERSLENDLDVEIWVDNIENDFGEGYIKNFKWIIGEKEITKEADITNLTQSSKITYSFDGYGEHDIKVIITDSAGQTKQLQETVNIPKILKLSKSLDIYNEEEIIEDLSYQANLNEYYINEIGIPTDIKLDARFVRANNLLYTLNKVEWDYNSDGDIDEEGKIGNYKISVEGNHKITVVYHFVNRRVSDDIITMKEKIFIEGIKKEAIIDFDIIKESSYVPITVSFDASKSQVKDENIEKFIWDYGDGYSDEKDSIVQGHKYTSAGDYDVKLTVVTTSGKKYSVTKKLILKPKPESVKISVSMKSTTVGQGIDFSSDGSEGQITAYFWDFGDGETSTEANPTHSYNKSGDYEVTLKLDFVNKNVLEGNINIKITNN